MRVAVIGGGPAGLVTLKYLATAHESLGCPPVQVQLFEYQPRVGGTFAVRTYEDAELVSSKQLTTFSDFRYAGPEDFLKTENYVQYLHDYCTHFRLWPFIKLRTRVTSVIRRLKGGHTVFYEPVGGGPPLQWDCDAVAVCSGLHVTPNIPDIKGLENVATVIHSSEFKTREQFGIDKTIMVIGSGETGADISYLAVTSPTRRVLMCHRDGFHFARKTNPGPVLLPILGRKPDPNIPGIPVDVSRANLFDTTYVHPLLRNHMLLWNYYDLFLRIFLWVSTGTSGGVDQWIGDLSPHRAHLSKVFFNKSNAVGPYLMESYRPKMPGWRLWVFALRSAFAQFPIKETHGKRVDLAPLPREFDAQGYVHFLDNGRLEFERLKDEHIKTDMVVLCTGYRQDFTFLGEEYPRPIDADVRGIWKRDEPSVGFIGFMRPSLGAIPPLAEMQAQLWVVNLLRPQLLPNPLSPKDEMHFRLLHPPNSRITYGVDHESYAYQLALDLGSAPGITDILGFIWRRRCPMPLRLLLIWALGANLNTKYRLMGPWRWEGAHEVFVSDELWRTLGRRPILFGHILTSLLPMMIFGPISALVWLYATVMDCVESVRGGIWGKAMELGKPQREDGKPRRLSEGQGV